MGAAGTGFVAVAGLAGAGVASSGHSTSTESTAGSADAIEELTLLGARWLTSSVPRSWDCCAGSWATGSSEVGARASAEGGTTTWEPGTTNDSATFLTKTGSGACMPSSVFCRGNASSSMTSPGVSAFAVAAGASNEGVAVGMPSIVRLRLGRPGTPVGAAASLPPGPACAESVASQDAVNFSESASTSSSERGLGSSLCSVSSAMRPCPKGYHPFRSECNLSRPRQ